MVTRAKTVKCWGDQGVLGPGATAPSSTPVDILGLHDVKALTAGNGYTCALLENGHVACWGTGLGAVLGRGNASGTPPVDTASPGAVQRQDGGELSGIVALAGGARHVCAIDDQQKVWCWGDSAAGQTAAPTTTPATAARPVVLGVPTPTTDLACGQYHCLTAQSGGTENRAWGTLPGSTNRSAPASFTLPDGTRLAKVAAGNAYSCGISTAGRVRCWGEAIP